MTQPVTVLLVEKDEPDFQFFNAVLKKGAPRRVQWAHDTDDACAYLAGIDGYADRSFFPLPQVVLVDLRKPGVGELEFVRWMRAQTALEHIPVVALTSAHDPADDENARALGVDAFHLRPADPQKLAALVDSLAWFWAQEGRGAPALGSHAA